MAKNSGQDADLAFVRLLAATVSESGLSREAIAAASEDHGADPGRITKALLDKYVEGTRPFARIGRLPGLMKQTKDFRILRWLAERCGHTVAPVVPVLGSHDLGVSDLLREFADVVDAVAARTAPDSPGGVRTTAEEAAQIRREGWQAIHAIYGVMLQAESEVCDVPAPRTMAEASNVKWLPVRAE